MSANQELERFSRDVAASPSLRQQIEAAGTDLASVVAFANAMGYGFTATDVTGQSMGGELSEEALGAVSGGAEPALASYRVGSFLLVSKSSIRLTAMP